MQFTHRRNNSRVILLAVFTYCCSMAQAQPGTGISAALKQCITKAVNNPYCTLAEEELARLSATEMLLLENFIYNRRFTKMRAPELRSYFAASDKTLTLKIKQDSIFIRNSQYNLLLLDAFRHADTVSCSSKEQLDSTLNGYWQLGTSVVAGTLLTHYHFLKQDHSFFYEDKAAGKNNPLVSYSGFYTFINKGIELEVRTKTMFKTKGINRSNTSGSKTSHIKPVHGTITVHLEDAYEYITVTLSPVYSIRFDGIVKQFCRINGKLFWKCYPGE